MNSAFDWSTETSTIVFYAENCNERSICRKRIRLTTGFMHLISLTCIQCGGTLSQRDCILCFIFIMSQFKFYILTRDNYDEYWCIIFNNLYYTMIIIVLFCVTR